jgi:hypothetical protein
MSQCKGSTASGTQCKHKVKQDEEFCWLHNGPQCSVCLLNLRSNNTRVLPCNHEFHIKCVDRWKRTCSPADPTCPMCRTPFDLPSYRCKLSIERLSDANIHAVEFTTQNVASITSGFGIDLRMLLQEAGTGRLFTDIHFDIDEDENLTQILRDLGLPQPPEGF